MTQKAGDISLGKWALEKIMSREKPACSFTASESWTFCSASARGEVLKAG